MDPGQPMSSTDLDEFNAFLNTWMQDMPMPEVTLDSGDLPGDAFANPIGASALELADLQQQQQQIKSAFLAGDPLDLTLFRPTGRTTLDLNLAQPQPSAAPSNPSSKSSQGNDVDRTGGAALEHSSSHNSGERIADSQLDLKKSRVLEKNRKAQKRFRDKQKNKMTDMEMQLEALQRNLEAVSLEKITYMRQNEVLNKVLELRQSQINVLTESARITHTMEELEEQRQSELAAAELAARYQVRPAQTRLAPVEQLRAMSGKEAVGEWRKLVERIAAVMVTVDGPGETPADALQQVEQLTEEAACFAQTLSIVNPQAIKILIMSNQETLQPDESRLKDPTFWAAAAGPLSLGAAQRDKILFLARGLKTAITRSGNERQQLAEELQELLPSTCGSDGNLSACIRSGDLIMQLRKNFQTEHEAWCTFSTTVLMKILTPLQFCRFAVNAFPLFPNSLQLAKYVCATSDHTSCGPCDRSAPHASSFVPKCEPHT